MAVQFLRSPKVIEAPLSRKLAFLEKKGEYFIYLFLLNECCECFNLTPLSELQESLGFLNFCPYFRSLHAGHLLLLKIVAFTSHNDDVVDSPLRAHIRGNVYGL